MVKTCIYLSTGSSTSYYWTPMFSKMLNSLLWSNSFIKRHWHVLDYKLEADYYFAIIIYQSFLYSHTIKQDFLFTLCNIVLHLTLFPFSFFLFPYYLLLRKYKTITVAIELSGRFAVTQWDRLHVLFQTSCQTFFFRGISSHTKISVIYTIFVEYKHTCIIITFTSLRY